MPTPALNLLLRTRRPVLSRAVWAVSAARELGNGRGLVDLSGNGLHAIYGGNASTPTTNDPLRLSFAGERSVYFPGSTGNTISSPDSPSLDITGDLEIMWDAEFADYSAAGSPAFFAKYVFSTDNRSWRITPSTGGAMMFTWSPDGTSASAVSANLPAHGVANGARQGFKVTLDVDNGAGGWTARLFQAPNRHGPWTLVGAPVSGAGVTSIFAGTAPLEIASQNNGTASLFASRFYYAEVRSGIGGAIVASFDASQLAEPYASYTDPQGNVWTLNRSATGRKLAVVDRDMLLIATDDFAEALDSPLLDFAAGQDFTAVAAVRMFGAPTGYILSKSDGSSSASWGLIPNTTNRMRALAYDTASQDTNTANNAWASGVPMLAAMRRLNGSLYASVGGIVSAASPAVAGSLANAHPLRIGSRVGGAYNDMEFFGAAVFREALSTVDLARLAREMGVPS